MTHEKEWLKAENVLCVRLDSMGDVLMTTPALRALKENRPDRRLTLLTSQSGAKIAPLLREVDDTIVYEAPWMKAELPARQADDHMRVVETLRSRHFDAAVIFTVFSQNPLPAALLAYMAGIPLRLAHCRENPYHLLTNWVPESDAVDQPTIRHETRRQLDLVKHIGHTTRDERLALEVEPESVGEVLMILKEAPVDTERPWIVIHPGGTAPSRRYPPEHFARVADELVERHGFQVIFTGSAGEAPLVEEIQARMEHGSVSLAGELGINELCALIFLAPLLISNNTGPVHIAAAVQTPVVDLYALTNPQHTPWKVLHRTLYHDVLCKFCYKSICPVGHHACLRQVQPEEVVKAALDLYEENQLMVDLGRLPASWEAF